MGVTLILSLSPALYLRAMVSHKFNLEIDFQLWERGNGTNIIRYIHTTEHHLQNVWQKRPRAKKENTATKHT